MKKMFLAALLFSLGALGSPPKVFEDFDFFPNREGAPAVSDSQMGTPDGDDRFWPYQPVELTEAGWSEIINRKDGGSVWTILESSYFLNEQPLQSPYRLVMRILPQPFIGQSNQLVKAAIFNFESCRISFSGTGSVNTQSLSVYFKAGESQSMQALQVIAAKDKYQPSVGFFLQVPNKVGQDSNSSKFRYLELKYESKITPSWTPSGAASRSSGQVLPTWRVSCKEGSIDF